jgi:hypothetical protein
MNTRLPIAALLLLTPAAGAQDINESPLQSLFACQAITESVERLACLDREVAALRTAETEGGLVAVSRREIEAAEEASYGLSIPNFSLPSLPRLGFGRGDGAETTVTRTSTGGEIRRDSQGRIEEVTGEPIVAVRRDAQRRYVFELANGQHWRQNDATRVFVPNNIEGHTADIQSGTLGSHLMRIDDSNRWFRAVRIQ